MSFHLLPRISGLCLDRRQLSLPLNSCKSFARRKDADAPGNRCNLRNAGPRHALKSPSPGVSMHVVSLETRDLLAIKRDDFRSKRAEKSTPHTFAWFSMTISHFFLAVSLCLVAMALKVGPPVLSVHRRNAALRVVFLVLTVAKVRDI